MTSRNKQRVYRWLRKWQRRHLLDTWQIDVTFSDTPDPDDDDDYANHAQIVTDARYTRIYVTVFPQFDGLTEKAQEEWIAHELGHAALAPLSVIAMRAVRRKQAIKRDVEDAEERAVEQHCRALWRAYGRK